MHSVPFFVNDVVSQNDADGHADHLLPASWSMSFGFVEHAFWSRGACLLASQMMLLGYQKSTSWKLWSLLPRGLMATHFVQGGTRGLSFPAVLPPPERFIGKK